MDYTPFIQPAIWAAPVIVILILLRVANIFRYIPNNQVGIVEKLWTTRGSIKAGFIALDGEAGFEPEVLRGGLHLFFPFMYRIHRSDLVTVGQGKIAYVFARDGAPLGASQVLGANDTEDRSDFQDARKFLLGGGQKGPQRKILREGTYAINTTQFAIITDERVYGHALSQQERTVLDGMQLTIAERWGFAPVILAADHDLVGIVTVHDGPSLPSGEIIAPEVGADLRKDDTFHNNFQEPEKFLKAGGYRGRQLQVIVEGTWYINRLFATVEAVPKSVIPVGNVGVVIFYTGPKTADVSGEQYRHGELVLNGSRGVWRDPLLPGKYAFNTYAGKIEIIPTVNFILKWVRGEVGAMKLDENLSEISLITKDAFEPTLPLSVVMHIDYKKAPMIIQRFGDVKKLVEQTLDPMVSAFFKNIAQKMTLIELLQNRASIQEESATEMKAKFEAYSLELQEVLIGTPRAAAGDQTIENILIQLRSRQIAREQVETYQEQEEGRDPGAHAQRGQGDGGRAVRADAIADPGQGQRERGRRSPCPRAKGCGNPQGDGGRGRRAVKVGRTGRGRSGAGGRHGKCPGHQAVCRRLWRSRIPLGGAEFRKVRGSPDQDQSALGAAVSDVRRARSGECRGGPDPDRDAEFNVRPDDARCPREIEGRGAKAGAQIERPLTNLADDSISRRAFGPLPRVMASC
jgi:uncharacterized membrane protein YqiK